MTTTNGTKALLASLEADRVLVGAFVNRAATLRAVANESRPIHLVCAGTDGFVSFEDTRCSRGCSPSTSIVPPGTTPC